MHYLLILSALPSLVSVLAIVLPSGGTGPYRTQINTTKITDQSRADPYALDGRKRSLMLSIISPIDLDVKSQMVTTQYMPDLSASFFDQLYVPFVSNGTFGSFELPTWVANKESVPHHHHFPRPTSLPIVIFSPGLRTSRLLYTALCQSIASHGMHVVTIDHPYDALIVEYPDGSYVLSANITTDEQIEQDIGVRVKDIEFIINSLMAGTILSRQPAHSHNQSQIFMLGHSLGGATAVSAMLEDPRILAGSNMDGRFFLNALPDGDGEEVTSPFLLISNQRRNTSTDSTWDVVQKKFLTGQTSAFQLMGTEHGSFTDLPLLFKALKANISSVQGLEDRIGSVDGLEILRLITAVVVTFFRDVAIETMAKSLWTNSG